VVVVETPDTTTPPACPYGHEGTVLFHQKARPSQRLGERRRYVCRWTEAGHTHRHYFTHPPRPTTTTPGRKAQQVADHAVRRLLDRAIVAPRCPREGHETRRVAMFGTYETLSGPRQRYRCFDPDSDETHTFTAVLPRSAVEDDDRCPDCGVLTPRNSGSEASTRRLNYPADVVFQVLLDLSNGLAYSHASMKALQAMGRPTGRSREVAQVVRGPDGEPLLDDDGEPILRMATPKELNEAGQFSPEREQKAHWHIAADVLERFGPVVIDPALARITADEAAYRAEGLPVVYFADEVDVRRDYARSAYQTSAPVVWTALVVSRTHWERDDAGRLVGRTGKLVRFRAMPNRTAEAWELVFRELGAPDFLIADGASAIGVAAQRTWGNRTTLVPCVYHAMASIQRRLTPKKAKTPAKLRDHLFLLTRKNLAAGGARAVKAWFDELEQIAAAEPLPLDVVASLRKTYEPLLARAAKIAQEHPNPEVAISNSPVEKQIEVWVKKVTQMRGPMYSNLPRTNLLGDLVVAGSNGALLDRHAVIHALRDTARGRKGWVPPPRALVEPAGAVSLRDAFSIDELLTRPPGGTS
jgi:hypothetical protein